MQMTRRQPIGFCATRRATSGTARFSLSPAIHASKNDRTFGRWNRPYLSEALTLNSGPTALRSPVRAILVRRMGAWVGFPFSGQPIDELANHYRTDSDKRDANDNIGRRTNPVYCDSVERMNRCGSEWPSLYQYLESRPEITLNQIRDYESGGDDGRYE